MRAYLFLTTLCLALGSFSIPVKRDDVITIESHITNTNTKTKLLDTSIAAFLNSGPSIIQGLSIYDDVVRLEQAMETATSDANASDPFSETDCNAILDLVKTLVPNMQQAVSNFINNKAALTGLPIPGAASIMLRHLQTLKKDSDALVAALLAKTPDDLMSVAQAQVTLVDTAFSDAIAAYSP